MSELLPKLIRLYPKRVETDVFGRREATPAEIQAMLSGDFCQMEKYYPPTTADLIKDDPPETKTPAETG